MTKLQWTQVLKNVQQFYTDRLAEHAKIKRPSAFTDELGQKLFDAHERVTLQLAKLL